MRISSQFDAGNIIVKDASDPQNVRLEIRKDNGSDFYQWFYFRVTGAAGRLARFVIENAAGAAYPGGWENYEARMSSDLRSWGLADTSYEDGKLIIETLIPDDSVWFAYFAPYTLSRHGELIALCQHAAHAKLDVIGQTLDGRDIDRLTFGEPATGKKTIWVTARQHPGESMAQWAAEGLLDRLVSDTDPGARDLLNRAVVHVVPNMNPDGSFRGHLRTNAKGINLNREWDKASEANSPEVFAVLQQMKQTGVDLFLDLHGDEALPYNFIAGAEGVPGWTSNDQDKLDAYKAALSQLNPDFQTEHGYDVDAPGSADLSIATNWMRHAFGCLAMTLEMPFKDSAITPDEDEAWSPERAMAMGASQIDAMRAVLDRL
jgi:murein tripeptide amidase MpaA